MQHVQCVQYAQHSYLPHVNAADVASGNRVLEFFLLGIYFSCESGLVLLNARTLHTRKQNVKNNESQKFGNQ